MNIVKQKLVFLNKSLILVPKKIKKLYLFGFSILVFQHIHSLRSNARLTGGNWHTVKSKIYRLTINGSVSLIFPLLLKELSMVGEKDIIAVDFSDFGPYHVLMFAKQTRKGRAIPVYFETLTYPIEKGSQTIFTKKAIKNFSNILGFKPKLVFDRCFAGPYLVRSLVKNKHSFVVRVKKDKLVKDFKTQKTMKVKDALKDDFEVVLYGRKLRVVISDREKVKEPWYLLTNDFVSTRASIVKNYYHRFEIEEFFRDTKRLLWDWNMCIFKESKALRSFCGLF